MEEKGTRRGADPYAACLDRGAVSDSPLPALARERPTVFGPMGKAARRVAGGEGRALDQEHRGLTGVPLSPAVVARLPIFGRSAMSIVRWPVVLLLLLALPAAAAAVSLDYCTLLRNLTDLDKLAILEPGVRCREFTSYDRAETTRPGANGDAGQYLRVEPNGEAVMAEMTGPGCIVRLWSANPQGKIRLYLDGAKTPQFEWDFDQLFRGGIAPFRTPIVYKQGGPQSASDCYLPIPYARSCKVTADRKWGQYYHIWFRSYPADWRVPTFRLPLSATEQAALEEVCAVWQRTGQRPRPTAADARTISRHALLGPGEALELAGLRGPGIIQAVRIRADAPERYPWRKLWLEGRWDGEEKPSLAAPLDGLFGTGYQANEYKSLPAGVVDGQGYLYFPMPFAERADLRLINQGRQPASVALELTVASVARLPEHTAYFHTRWRREAPATTFDYPLLEAAGAGRLVGLSLNIDNPAGGWWGEGDEKLWVDGRSWDELIGTGSEDYFGDAWGLHLFQQPFFGVSMLQGTRTCAYRWHVVDNVPFERSLKFTIENYPPFRPDYTSTCFWYASPGATDFFAATTAYEARRPWGRSLAATLEAEDLTGLGGRIVEDEGRPAEFSHGRAVDLGAKAGGEICGPFKITVPAEDAYYPVAHLIADAPPAPMELVVDGTKLQPTAPPSAPSGDLDYPGVWLTAGEHALSWRYTGGGSAVLDCFQIAPSPKPYGAIEAEGLKVVATSGPVCQTERARLKWGARGPTALPGHARRGLRHAGVAGPPARVGAARRRPHPPKRLRRPASLRGGRASR